MHPPAACARNCSCPGYKGLKRLLSNAGDGRLRSSCKLFWTTVAIILNTTLAEAGMPPRQLYGKGIRIQYTVETTVAGARKTREVVSSIDRTVYVSTAGRLFERAVSKTDSHTGTSDNGPGASSNRAGDPRGMTFQGNNLVAHIAYASGAGQMTIRFDPTFSSCQGQVVFGAERGQTMARRSYDGIVRQILSIKASSVTCSVTAGNPL